MSKILITGGKGLVGTRLTKMLIDKNHQVVILTRTANAQNEYEWNISEKKIDKEAFVNVDYIIHLAGAGIADERWTSKRKKTIIDSRVETANLIFNTIKENNIKIKGFISASGIGYYGAITSDTIFEETDKAGTDFFGEVCGKWENAAHKFKNLNIPVTILRTGIVLSDKGGALEKMRVPVISPLGSGKQYLPWIHNDDLCNIYIQCIEDNLNGIYNAIAPEHQTSITFSKALAKSINRPYVSICVPNFMLKLLFGDLSVILLEGSRVSAKKIENNGYSFRFKTLKKALNNL